MASFGMKVIRAAFGVGERIAPRLAGHAGFALFARTPSAKAQTPAERLAASKASAFMQTARHHRLRLEKGFVTVHEFRPEPGVEAQRGSVLVLHGWRSRTEYMRAIIEGHRLAGYRVWSLDLPGHGASSGRSLNMLTALKAVRLCGDWFGPFEAVIGHSFGGAVAVNAVVGSVAAIPPLAAARLVVIAAPNAISDVLDGFASQINLGARSRVALARRIEVLTGRTVEDFTGSRLLANVKVPTLVVHAPDDREVPASDAEAYAAAGDHVRPYWASGLGHRRILSDEYVVRAIVAFALDDPRDADAPPMHRRSA